MRHLNCGIMSKLILGMVLCGLSFAGRSALGDDVFVGTLEPAASGGLHALVEQKITFSPTRPTAVTKEPIFAYAPQYASLSLGNGKNNSIALALDTDGITTRPRLYVDTTGTGDLRTPISMTAVRGVGESSGKVVYSASVLVNARYDVAGRGGIVPSMLTFTLRGTELSYNREYARVGKLVVGSKSYRIALVDETIDGKFDDFKHDDGAPKVSLYVDRQNKGTFDPKKDRFDAAKPVRLAGATFEVISIDPRGTSISLRGLSKSAGISAANLRPGSDVIEFETETVDGKTVRFPQDFRGKVVMLDFWAMWCQPCLAEMPNVISVYKEYHPRGFEILGVSLDQAKQKTALITFLARNNMPWSQIYDGGFWKAEIAQLYDVNAIPHAILLDGTTGKIVAMGDDLRGQGLAPAVEGALMARKRE